MPKYSGRLKGSKLEYETDSGIYDLADVVENVVSEAAQAAPGQVAFTTPGSHY